LRLVDFPDKVLGGYISLEYPELYDKVWDEYMSGIHIPFDRTTYFLTAIASATKYPHTPKNIYEISKKTRSYNLFVENLKKYLKQNEDQILFYLL
jgi:hypothetical protein